MHINLTFSPIFGIKIWQTNKSHSKPKELYENQHTKILFVEFNRERKLSLSEELAIRGLYPIKKEYPTKKVSRKRRAY